MAEERRPLLSSTVKGRNIERRKRRYSQYVQVEYEVRLKRHINLIGAISVLISNVVGSGNIKHKKK